MVHGWPVDCLLYACAPLIDGLGLATQTVLATSHRLAVCVCVSKHCHKMKGTKVQTLGACAVAGAWCMAGWLIAI